MGDTNISEVIELAWCDRTSFEMIRKQTGLTERDVISVMRCHLKPKAFQVWRTRVKGRHRKARHDIASEN
ncbi:MAG: TIGR03643 family protein [Pseudomonadota bacterium]